LAATTAFFEVVVVAAAITVSKNRNQGGDPQAERPDPL